MPHLTFPITAEGLVVPVVIGMTGRDARARVAAGQPVPMPIAAAGVIDTGNNITCVAVRILHQLGLPRVHQLTSQTVGGTMAAT